MIADVIFAPLLPWPAIAAAAVAALLLIGVVVVRRGRGWLPRVAAVLILSVALLDPRMIRELRQPLADIALVIADASPSQDVGDRRAVTEAALATLTKDLGEQEGIDVRVVVADEDRDRTRLFAAAERVLPAAEAARLAGVVLLTDGQVHDAPAPETSPVTGAPLHVLLTGRADDRDRRLRIEQSPAYGVVGGTVDLAYRVDDLGPPPAAGPASPVTVRVRVDGLDAGSAAVTPGTSQILPLTLTHGGPTAVEIEVEAADGEVSTRNNRAAVVVNGVRERLKVLLISGQPHLGERTWRNLLKSDPAVDLVHFTILRPPEKDDATPLKELALIIFPVQELFEKRLYDFDLLIFDRYVLRGVLPTEYFEHMAAYVREGGAMLIAAGPEFAGARSLYRTPLAPVMPVVPTGKILEQEFRPLLTGVGRRHPVTAHLPGETVAGDRSDDDPAAAESGGVAPAWGRWFRAIETEARSGQVLMEGPGARPLVVLDRVGEGRIALLTSDQIWLWARGFDGGGPHAELLRRLAHWLMKEPALEEEGLAASVSDGRMIVERRSLVADAPASVTVTTPGGEARELTLEPAGDDGIARGELAADDNGLFRVTDGQRTAVAVAGRLGVPEFADLRASAEPLAALARSTGGSIGWLADGLPQARQVAAERDAAGRGWIGFRRNHAYAVTGTNEIPLLPELLLLALALAAFGGAWWREGR
jgi:hypothetical protein